MRHSPIQDVSVAHAPAHGPHARARLGDHPFGQRAVDDHAFELVGRELGDHAPGVTDVLQQTLDVREIDELLGPQFLGDRTRRGVGVDVVRLALEIAADGGDDRNELLTQQTLEDRRVDGVDVTDEAEVG